MVEAVVQRHVRVSSFWSLVSGLGGALAVFLHCGVE